MARGWAHIGAIKALLKLGFHFDVVAGCSAGALVGGFFLADRLDALEDWATSLNRRKMLGYMDMRLRRGGLIGGGKLLDEMRNVLGDTMVENLPVPFAAVATDLVIGHEVWFQQGNLVEAIRASFSVPGIFPPVNIGHRWLVDGALVCPLPVSVCRAMGADMVVAVNLNADAIGKSRRRSEKIPAEHAAAVASAAPPDEEKDKETAEKTSFAEGMARMFHPDYDGPSIFGAMSTSLNIMQDRITRSRLAGDPPDVHITPRLGDFGLLEFERAEEAIAEGEAAVLRQQVELEDALALFN